MPRLKKQCLDVSPSIYPVVTLIFCLNKGTVLNVNTIILLIILIHGNNKLTHCSYL